MYVLWCEIEIDGNISKVLETTAQTVMLVSGKFGSVGVNDGGILIEPL